MHADKQPLGGARQPPFGVGVPCLARGPLKCRAGINEMVLLGVLRGRQSNAHGQVALCSWFLPAHACPDNPHLVTHVLYDIILDALERTLQ